MTYRIEDHGNGYGRGSLVNSWSAGDLDTEELKSYGGGVYTVIGNGKGRCSSRFAYKAEENGHGRDLRGGGTTRCTGGPGVFKDQSLFERLEDNYYNVPYIG